MPSPAPAPALATDSDFSGKIDPNQIDKYGDNLAHYLLLWRKKTGTGSEYLEKEILPKVKDWNFPNIDN